MGIFEKEEDLFEKWRELVGEEFVPDGVACERGYLDSSPKILFVLKEANGHPGDLRGLMLRGGAGGKHWLVWHNITRWVQGIRGIFLDEDRPFTGNEDLTQEHRQAVLRDIAVVNLKKTYGSGRTKMQSVRQWTSNYEPFIREQIGLYEAEVTICGGCSDVFDSIVEYPREVDWQKTDNGVYYHEAHPGRYVIDYYHPGYWVLGQRELYRKLMDAVREVRSGGRME